MTGANAGQIDIDEFRIASADLTVLADEEGGPDESEAGGDSLKPPNPHRKLSRRWIAVLLSVLG